MTRPVVFRDPTLSRDSPYSYACGACSRCCRHYLIRVNPYEVLRLARHHGIGTGDFIRDYVGPDTTLKHKPDDTCIFLGPRGCSVHPARPLVCRLYPLGRQLSGDGKERFFHMEPHPETEGVYGEAGSVGDYLHSQGALPFLAAADRYMSVFQHFFSVLAGLPKGAALHVGEADASGLLSIPIPDLLDPEKAVAMILPGRSIAGLDGEEAMALHIEALEVWLTQFQPEERRNEQQD